MAWGGSLCAQRVVQELPHRAFQDLEWGGHSVPPCAEQVGAGDKTVGLGRDDGSEATAGTVPRDCSAHSTDGICDACARWSRWGRVEHSTEGERTPANRANPGQGLEGRTVPDSGNQAERRLRPRERRLFSTARPPRVRIRRRKPWVFFRLRLLG